MSPHSPAALWPSPVRSFPDPCAFLRLEVRWRRRRGASQRYVEEQLIDRGAGVHLRSLLRSRRDRRQLDEHRSVTATVLFTDLVGSTELLFRLGEHAFDGFRRAHFAALEDATATAGGIVGRGPATEFLRPSRPQRGPSPVP